MEKKWIRLNDNDDMDVYINIDRIISIDEDPDDEYGYRYVHVAPNDYYTIVNSMVDIINRMEHPLTLLEAYIEGTPMEKKANLKEVEDAIVDKINKEAE